MRMVRNGKRLPGKKFYHKGLSTLSVSLILLSAVLFHTASANAALNLTDAWNRPLTITQPPQRVVSLVPGVTEMLLALGLGERLQGVTIYDHVPPQTGKPAVVGGFFSPNLQAIEQCRPDCIFVADLQQEVQQRFKDSGIPVINLSARAVQDIFAHLRLLGSLFQQESKAEELCRHLQAQLDLIGKKTAQIPPVKKLRVVRLMSNREMLTPGDDSFQNDFIRLAGGIPPTWGKKGPVVPVTLSAWQQFNPQAIFACGHDWKRFHQLVQQPGWQEVEGVRQGRLLTFPCELTCRASVRTGDFISWLATSLYPEELSDVRKVVLKQEILARKPLHLDLPYVRQTEVVTSRILDFEHKSLVIDFTTPVQVISTLEGPRSGILTAGNHYTPPPCWPISHYLGLEKDRRLVYNVLKKTEGKTSFLFTGADMGNLSVQKTDFKDLKLYALVTAGVESNALRLSQDEGRYYEPGTINIIVLSNYRLSPRAMSRALIAVTEAKTAALQDLDIRSTEQPLTYQATGTGTDNSIVVGGQGKTLDNAGGHSKLGELIGRAVYQGVREAVGKQNGLGARRPIWQRLQERRLDIYDVITASLPPQARPQILQAWEAIILQPRYAGFLEAALSLSDAWEQGQVQDLEAFKVWCESISQELAGRPLKQEEEKMLSTELPLPLKMAGQAIISGLAVKCPAAAKQ
ncbi:MAG TPA: adenosylcobinamide amidohydrolase [Desulfobacterales bacterium]|nr:adenosylcobinamide amidohydrolase [Desulfobacterales bacterium]